jgi:hypothetical protein
MLPDSCEWMSSALAAKITSRMQQRPNSRLHRSFFGDLSKLRPMYLSVAHPRSSPTSGLNPCKYHQNSSGGRQPKPAHCAYYHEWEKRLPRLASPPKAESDQTFRPVGSASSIYYRLRHSQGPRTPLPIPLRICDNWKCTPPRTSNPFQQNQVTRTCLQSTSL